MSEPEEKKPKPNVWHRDPDDDNRVFVEGDDLIGVLDSIARALLDNGSLTLASDVIRLLAGMER